MASHEVGAKVPRLYTPPLRELNERTTRGFEFIAFCREILGVELYPWQQWLAIHALELNADDTYRYRRILVMVGRQNGKTLFASCLAAWWLYIDAAREPGKATADFKIVGVAQNIDVAREPYLLVRRWADPRPASPELAELTIPALSAATAYISRTNGREEIIAKSGAHYQVRAADGVRGKPTARVLMDEVREQKTWTAWNAISQTPKSFINGQLWGISNASDASAVVLAKMRKSALKQAELAERLGDAYADTDGQGVDTTKALFEWSAPPEADPTSAEAILAANPSIGYGGITVEKCVSDFDGWNEADYRAEVLCQFVQAKTTPYIDPEEFRACIVDEAALDIDENARTVWAVDTSADRERTVIAAAVMCTDGVPFVYIFPPRLGMLWVPSELAGLADDSGHLEVMLQERGCPAMEFRQPLADAGLNVRAVPGSWFGIATGRFRDAIRDGRVRFIDQEPLDFAIRAGVTRAYGETQAWSRKDSAVDISPAVAATLALYGLENPVDVPLSAYAKRGLIIL